MNRETRRARLGWRGDARFERYVDLFDERRFFEAHEVLEDLWLEIRGEDREFLQGLIQIAVALEHRARGNPRGARKVLDSAKRRLERYGDSHAGIEAGVLMKAVADCLAGVRSRPPRLRPRVAERPKGPRSHHAQRGAQEKAPVARVRPGAAGGRKGVLRVKASAARSGRTLDFSIEPDRIRRKRASAILAGLRQLYPDAHCELTHGSALELLVATILSAQCTDVRVNMTTPALFKRYRDARAYAEADPAELGNLIRSTGFFNNKSRSIIALGKALMERHSGQVPATMEELVELPGVGRKTANVLLSEWYGKPGIAVDTHVIRLTGPVWRLTDSTDAVQIERDLYELLPEADRSFFGIATIFHGRRICTARKPACEACLLSPICPSAFRPPS